MGILKIEVDWQLGVPLFVTLFSICVGFYVKENEKIKKLVDLTSKLIIGLKRWLKQSYVFIYYSVFQPIANFTVVSAFVEINLEIHHIVGL